MEEAQQIAQDYIVSLDNLPIEIKFIMEEIKLKEQESMELQNQVNRRIYKSLPRITPPGKDINLTEKIQPELDRIEHLAQAKVELSNRLVMLLTRTCGRLEHDINRVRVASGEVPLMPTNTMNDFSTVSLGIPSSVAGVGLGAASIAPVTRATNSFLDSVKTAIAIPEPAPSPPSTTGLGGFKRRKLGTASGAVNNSPVMLSPATVPTGPRPSRLSNATNARPSPPVTSHRRGAPSRPLQNESAGESHDEADDVGDTEDKQLYCFCRKMSYGEMIGCDNDSCHYQWFHLSCVGLKQPLPEQWYCSECIRLLGINPEGVQSSATQGAERAARKGRKKQ